MSRTIVCIWINIAFHISGCYTQVELNQRDNPEADFCVLVDKEDFHATSPIINRFLETLPDNDDRCLEKLKAWLEQKKCVREVEIVCKSCIATFPAQSHVRVSFDSRKHVIVLMMDIAMGEKARLRQYHNFDNH